MEIKQVGLGGLLCVTERAAALARAVAAAGIPGVIETVPGFASLLVRYDPLRVSARRLQRRLNALADTAESDQSPARTVEIPVCYGGEYGPDLPFVAQRTGLSTQQVIDLHSAGRYPIRMIGFLPGFPYLSGLDERLHTPRLDAPRAVIPAGSVGIGGAQTGIYPMASPGGWQLIGRTPLRLFIPGQPPLYAAGDVIRFVPISPAQYQEMEAAAWASK